jgi:hypothetical protein
MLLFHTLQVLIHTFKALYGRCYLPIYKWWAITERIQLPFIEPSF